MRFYNREKELAFLKSIKEPTKTEAQMTVVAGKGKKTASVSVKRLYRGIHGIFHGRHKKFYLIMSLLKCL